MRRVTAWHQPVPSSIFSSEFPEPVSTFGLTGGRAVPDNRSVGRLPVVLAASVLVAGLTPEARAETATAGPERIEEVVVTAEFRPRSELDVPASVTVLKPDDGRTGAVTHLEELLGRVANLNFTSGASRARFIQIRGIGERSQFEEPLNPSVGLLLDGADMSGIGTAATLLDAAQVEVLRGPQGTLYGANALAGLISVTSRDPLDRLGGEVRLDLGDYGAFGLSGVLSGPLGEDAGYRLALQRHQDDGFIHNLYLGADDTAARDELTARGKLVWRTGRESTWQLSAGLIDVDNGYDNFSLDNDRRTRSDEPGMDAQETLFGSLRLERPLGDRSRLVAVAGLTDSDIDYGYDEDWTFAGFHPDGYSSTDRYLRDRWTGSLDLRLVSAPGARIFGGTTDWVAGLYGLRQEESLRREYTFAAGPLESDFDFERLAGYGEFTRHLDDRNRLTLGLRLEQHRADYADNQGIRFDPTDTFVGGRLLFERDLESGALFYAGLTRGYKAGGFNVSGTLPPSRREYDPEYLWNLETGLKGRWFDDRLSASAALFYMDRRDIQVATSETLVRADGSTEFIDLIGNAAEGSNYGAELNVDWQISERLSVFGQLGWLDTEFDGFINSAGVDLDGRDQAQAPGYQYFAGVSYRPAPGLTLTLSSEGKDDFYFSDGHGLQSDPYELIHASLRIEGQAWTLDLWARNLTDEDYFVRGFFFGNDPRDGYTSRGFTQLGEPRRYGATLRMRF